MGPRSARRSIFLSAYQTKNQRRFTGTARKKREFDDLIRSSDFDKLDIVPADFRLRHLDSELSEHKHAEQRLAKLLARVSPQYDIGFLDCPPSMSMLAENIFKASHWVLVPLIPTPLSLRAFDQVVEYFADNSLKTERLLPFFLDGRQAQEITSQSHRRIRAATSRIDTNLRPLRKSDREDGRTSGAGRRLRAE